VTGAIGNQDEAVEARKAVEEALGGFTIDTFCLWTGQFAVMRLHVVTVQACFSSLAGNPQLKWC
jgi:hypothetical protein